MRNMRASREKLGHVAITDTAAIELHLELLRGDGAIDAVEVVGGQRHGQHGADLVRVSLGELTRTQTIAVAHSCFVSSSLYNVRRSIRNRVHTARTDCPDSTADLINAMG